MTELTFVVAPDYAPTEPQALPRVQVQTEVQQVREKVTIRPIAPTNSATHVARTDDEWTWRELRDYVVNQVERFSGPFPRSDVKEASIFKAFMERHGSDSAPIARYAFDAMNGQWKGAPISINRFCKGSDAYFADMIKEHLHRNVL